MEQVYRDIKKEWGSDQDVINKMKNLLITSTDILASKLPSLYVSDDKFSTAPSVTSKSAHIVDSNEASNSANTIIQRSDHLQVKNKPILFNSYVKINITKCFNQTVKGVVMNGSVTYYSIEASVFIKDTTPRVFEQNRRYSEFQALHQLLVKKYAHIFIPSLPKIDDALIENGLASKRKRQLCIWLLIPCSLVHIFIYLLIPMNHRLQYIVLHGDLQKSNDMAKFLSQGQHENYMAIFNHAISSSKKNLPTKLSPVETRIKFREISTVMSDINQLSYHSANVTKSTKVLIKSIVDHAKTLANVGNYMKNITERSDGSNTKEYRLWTVSGMLISEIYPHLVAVGQIVLTSIYENVSFLGNDCFQTANDICEISNGIINSIKLNEEEKVVIVNNVSSEWATYRYLRKIIMQQHIERALVDITDQYNQIIAKLNIAHDEIHQFIIADTGSDEVSIEAEYGELKRILDSEIDDLEALVLSNKGIKIGSSHQSERYIPPLHHDNLYRPLLPPGVRKEPSKVSLDDSYIRSNEEIIDYNRLSVPCANRLRAVTPTHDEEMHVGTHDATENHKLSSWKSYFKPTLGASKVTQKENDNDNDRAIKSNHAFDKLWNILVKPKRNTLTDNQDSGSDSSDAEVPLGTSSYSDVEEDTPMNIAYTKKAKDLLEAQHQDTRQRHELVEEIFERRRNRRGKIPNVQGSGSGVARRPKAKVNNTKDDIYASTIKPAEAVSGVAYVGPANAHDYLASSIPSVNTASIPARPVPRTRTGSDTNINSSATNNNKTESDLNDNRQQASSVPKSVNIPDLPIPASYASNNVTNNNSDLPSGWEEVHGENGTIYYYHKFTRLSRWDKPDAAVAASIEASVRDQQDKMNELNRKRKEEIEQKNKQQELRQKTADQLKAKIKIKIEKWKGVTNDSTVTNHIGDLLTALPSILSFIPVNTITTSPLNSSSSQADIKKAYLKAIRLVHPDKLNSDLDLENQLLAQACFIIINETYDKYRETV